MSGSRNDADIPSDFFGVENGIAFRIWNAGFALNVLR